MSAASLSNDEIEDRYFLLGRMEILNTLNDLIHRREAVTVYFNGGSDFILTLLLEANANALIFDFGGDKSANLRLEKAHTCVFIATPDGIRVQFSGTDPQRVQWGETEAFSVALPDRIVRLQRRESFRTAVPVVNPIKAKLYNEISVAIGDWPIHDLSVGGFAVTSNGIPKLKVGDEITRVIIQLGTFKRISCPGIVRHITLADKQGAGRYRVGIEFVDLPHANEVDIQRYNIKIEYERRKLFSQR
jgi:flagellar brake protein